jgi:hypothetical protein
MAFRDLKADNNWIMDSIEQLDRLYSIHKLIQQEKTGTPDEFAKQFHLSKKTTLQCYGKIERARSYF